MSPAVAPGPIWTPIPAQSFTPEMVGTFAQGLYHPNSIVSCCPACCWPYGEFGSCSLSLLDCVLDCGSCQPTSLCWNGQRCRAQGRLTAWCCCKVSTAYTILQTHGFSIAVFCLQTKEFGKGMTPIDRAGQPAELAPGFVFLAVNSGALPPCNA